MTQSFQQWTIAEIHEIYRTKKSSVKELTQEFLKNSKQIDQKILSVLRFTDDIALQKAAELDCIWNDFLISGKNFEDLILKYPIFGVSYALLDLIDSLDVPLKNTIVMETGGMKGKRKEMIKEELHNVLTKGLGVQKIHSEYGMTELLSQAYSFGDGLFECPPWMQIHIRDTEDALSWLENGKTGGINVIDLANLNSCSFIATQDLGKKYDNQSFEVLGRFDNSDIRGCNLMVL
jgi:hypothetical protein